MNGAIFNLNSHVKSNLSNIFIAELTRSFNGNMYSQNGPLLVTRVVKYLCNVVNLSAITSTLNCQGFHVLKQDQCYPIEYFNWKDLVSVIKFRFVMEKVE